MRYTITLNTRHPAITIAELLEKEWLIPRKIRYFLRVRKNIWCNGKAIQFHQTVTGGDSITLQIEESDYHYQGVYLGEKENIQRLYEDEHIIVVNKAVGIKTHPNQPTEKGTLQNDLAAYLAEQQAYPYVVHRLDKETSGAILFAKNPLVLPILNRLLEQKKIYRSYQAVVQGNLRDDLTINKKIGRNRHDRRKRIIDEKKGLNAITHVHVIKSEKKQTQVQCILETGRTHQIRVHLASIGHPVIGDPLYQKRQSKGRLMLHAYEMELLHPFTHEPVHIQAKPGLWNKELLIK